MVEYLHNAIRATRDTDNVITAQIADSEGQPITADCHLVIHKNETEMIMIGGTFINDYWNFEIAADMIKGLKGRYWYCIKHNDTQLCFLQPIYFC